MILRALGLVLLALGLLLVFALAALARGASLPLIAGLIEREASETLEREVTIGTAPFVRIGRKLTVRVADVRLANAPWAGPEPALALKEAEVVVDLASLVSGPVVVEYIRAEGLALNLARSEAGDSNLPPVQRTQEASTDSGESDGLVLLAMNLRDIQLQHEDLGTGAQRSFSIRDFSTTTVDDSRLTLRGDGQLQGKDWSLEGEHSGVASLIAGENLWGKVSGILGPLTLDASYNLPTTEHLRDISAALLIEGTLPPRIAELSPLLTAGQPLSADLQIEDIDPGVALDASIQVEEFEVRVQGRADHPGLGDGVDVSVDVNAGSLPRLASALNLGATAEVPLQVRGRVNREGRRIQISALQVNAGEHEIRGSVLIPEFPATTGADLDVTARGPSFAFYQRLFNRPFEADFPYQADVQLHRGDDEREVLATKLSIGGATLALDGTLGDFPNYRNSRLRVSAYSADLSTVGRAMEISLPEVSFDLQGEVSVSDAGRVSFEDLRALAAGAELSARGQLDTYPALDNLDVQISLETMSLQATAAAFGVTDLGNVPAQASTEVSGSLRRIQLNTLSLSAGTSSIESTSGTLVLTEAGAESNLKLRATLEDLPTILGAMAPEAMPRSAMTFDLEPVITSSIYGLALSNLQGPGIRGDAEVRVGHQWRIDEDAYLSADIVIDKPEMLLPPRAGYRPPQGPLELRGNTRGRSGRIDLSLLSAGESVLALQIEREGQGKANLRLRGGGDDLRVLGTHPRFPEGALPFRVNARGALNDDAFDLRIDEAAIAATRLSGSLELQRPSRDLRLDLVVPEADLGAWLQSERADDVDTPSANPPPGSQATRTNGTVRIIPETPLPVATLEGPRIDARIQTGPLGLPDPVHKDSSLIDGSDLHFTRGDGSAVLEIRGLTGGRGNLVGAISAQGDEAGVLVDADLRLDNLPIGFTAAGASLALLPKHSIDAKFNARGSTVRDLATSLGGEFFLTGGAGTLDDMSFSFATESFIQQLFTTLLPSLSKEAPEMRVQCTVLAARSEDGVIALEPGFVLRSERFDLSARGSVDLVRERFAIRFDNQARKGLGISAASLVNPYVQITGSLARPTIGLDVTSSAIAGGAAVATGGLTVIAKPLFGRFLDRRDPCQVAVERWERASASK